MHLPDRSLGIGCAATRRQTRRRGTSITDDSLWGCGKRTCYELSRNHDNSQDNCVCVCVRACRDVHAPAFPRSQTPQHNRRNLKDTSCDSLCTPRAFRAKCKAHGVMMSHSRNKILGHLGAILGPIGAILGPPGAILAHLGAILGSECRAAQCRAATCRAARCRAARCRGARCRAAQCRAAAGCRGARCRAAQ